MLPPCPARDLDRREELCRHHMVDKEEFAEWSSSVINYDDPCQISCHPVGLPDHVVRLNDSLGDGAICGKGRLSVCLAGICEVKVSDYEDFI